MGRQPFGADKVMEAVLACEQEVGGSGKEVRNPVRAVRAQLSKAGQQLSELTIRKYLGGLWDAGFIQMIEGGHRGVEWVGLTVLKREVSLSGAAMKSKVAKVEEKEVPAKSSPKDEPEPKRPVVAVLVDYDNTELGARDAGFQISFFRLKEFLRSFGEIWMPDVFLSPFAARKDGLTQMLWAAGFQVIACPMGSKEKDAVDSKMNWRARLYLEIPGVDAVVIVSRDADFNELAGFAADRHKKVFFVDVVQSKFHLQGSDPKVEVPHSREYLAFREALKYLENGMAPVDNTLTMKNYNFLKDVVSALKSQDRPKSLMGVRRDVDEQIKQKWEDQFADESFRQALFLLVDQNVLIKMAGRDSMQYQTNRDHAAFINAVSQKKH